MESSPDILLYLVIGILVLALSGILGLVIQVVLLWKMLRNEPERREITLAATYADKQEVAAINARVEKHAEENAASIRRLHGRIDPLVENTAGIKGQMEGFVTSFNNFTAVMTAQGKAK